MQFQPCFLSGTTIVPPGSVFSITKSWREERNIFVSLAPFDSVLIHDIWMTASTVIDGKLYLIASLPPTTSLNDEDECVWLFELLTKDTVRLILPGHVDGLEGCQIARDDFETLQGYIGVIPQWNNFSRA
ncbi:MAG: hypothetical protein K2X93_08530 [Candidatus Obscuribacterales bacterium]|nr:hypothetical protein [Candidatus Obscuribacterales bacterium]